MRLGTLVLQVCLEATSKGCTLTETISTHELAVSPFPGVEASLRKAGWIDRVSVPPDPETQRYC